MDYKKDSRISFSDRMIGTLISAVAIFITFAFLPVIAAFIKGGGMLTGRIMFEGWYWLIAFGSTAVAAAIGFVLGTERVIELIGSLWGTNKPKDGSWM